MTTLWDRLKKINRFLLMDTYLKYMDIGDDRDPGDIEEAEFLKISPKVLVVWYTHRFFAIIIDASENDCVFTHSSITVKYRLYA
jgi:hypothetical protein